MAVFSSSLMSIISDSSMGSSIVSGVFLVGSAIGGCTSCGIWFPSGSMVAFCRTRRSGGGKVSHLFTPFWFSFSRRRNHVFPVQVDLCWGSKCKSLSLHVVSSVIVP